MTDGAAFEAALDGLRPLEGTTHGDQALGTLEECRRIFRLKLAAPLDRGAPPLVVVAGGTNVGKTTVANALAGAELGRPTPLARGTKAAVIFAPAARIDAFRRESFLPGYERRDLASPDEANAESTAGTLFLLAHPPLVHGAPLEGLALADSPDIDSVFGRNRRVAWDLLYAADALVFVASEEKYNDEVCVEFLARAARHGKAIAAVLNKSAAPEALDDFRKNVIPRATRGGATDVVAIPPGAPPAAFEPLRAALARFARDPEGLRARARAGAAAALREEAEPVLEALRREAETLAHYRAEVREQAAAAARRYRASVAALPIVEFDRVFHVLAEALHVPVIDDVYARLRDASRPLGAFFRRALGLGQGAAEAARRVADRNERDRAAARVELGEALAAVRRLPDRYPPDLAMALRKAHAAGPEAERLFALDPDYADSLAREAERWTEAVARDLHARLRAHPGWLAVAKALKGSLRIGAAGAAIAMTGHIGPEDLVVGPAVDLLAKTGMEYGVDRAYFARKHEEFVAARAAFFERLATERVEALALARLRGATPEAVATLAAEIRRIAGEPT